MSPIWIIYYRLTAFVPRPLPRNEMEWHEFKVIMVEVFGLPNKPQTWATVLGFMSSTPAHRLRRSYGFLANVAKRLDINQVIDLERKKCMVEVQNLLTEKIKKYVDEQEKEGPVESADSGDGSDMCDTGRVERVPVNSAPLKDGIEADFSGPPSDIPTGRKVN